MRNVLSSLAMLLAAVFAAASLAGHQVDQLLREEEPIREILGGLPAEEQFSEAVSEMLVEELSEDVPQAAQGLLGGRAEAAIAHTLSDMLDDDQAREAWEEALQSARVDYADQLEQLFEEGSSGDPGELALDLDLSPVAEALTDPMREGLESTLGWLPFVDHENFEFLAPEVVVDIDAAAEDGADPYTWATLAAASEYWAAFAAVAGALGVLGLLLGHGRGRWVALSLGGILAAGLGVWVGLTAASPDFGQPQGLSAAALTLMEHVESGIAEWAQPAWWIFAGASGIVTLVGMLALAVHPPRTEPHREKGDREEAGPVLDQRRTRPVDWSV